MANKQIGWSTESNLLNTILNQLKRLTQLMFNLSSSSITCAQVPSCIDKADIEGILTGEITSHTHPYLRWVSAPDDPSDAGNENEVARDNNYLYVYNTDLSLWMRVAMSINWGTTTTTTTVI